MAKRKSKKLDPLQELAASLEKRRNPVRLMGLRGASGAMLAAELIRTHPDRPALILAASAKRSDALIDDLRSLMGQEDFARQLCTFPRHDTLPYDRFSPQPFLITARMAALYRLLAWASPKSREIQAPPLIVTDWTALAIRVPAREHLAQHVHTLEVGETIDRDRWLESLQRAGYHRMSLVEERGEMAVRGGIIDFFSPQADRPVRLEFFDDEIESIREFDAASQRSLSKLNRAVAAPARELILERSHVVACEASIRNLAKHCGSEASETTALIDALLRGDPPPGVETLVPLLLPSIESVFDYLPDNTLVILDDPDAGRERLTRYEEEARSSHATALNTGRLACPPEELLTSLEQIESSLTERRGISLERVPVLDKNDISERIEISSADHAGLRRELNAARTHERALAPLADQLADWVLENWRTIITVSALSSAERLRELLSQYGIECAISSDQRPCWHWSAAGRIEIRVTPLSEGFRLPLQKLAVLTEEEIFGRRQRRRTTKQWKEGAALESLSQLEPGGHLVHQQHGIGLYRGLQMVWSGHEHNELLCIEYAGGDKLFLPVHRLGHVQRYGAIEGASPKLDRLGGETWERSQRKVKKSLRNMAEELLAMQAARELATGFAFSPRDTFFEEFEAAFEFEETPDQAAAIEDVLGDMQNSRPMDRIVCGDVGYGKTEVAIRAALRAALDGKQVAVLTPTTILCEQHFETFLERFKGYPITVDMLSRFRTAAESREVLEGLATGRIDIVVATHRLLRKTVEFRDLGLLVIDEEHRFGVAQKERIKKLRRTVDVLTLTATPIPRTLEMALTGMRDLSVIDTPPVDRLAIRTQVCLSSPPLIREAILREIRRGGQVFFLHNRVASIGHMAQMLAEEVPEVKVMVAHGQLKEKELEDRMHAFVRGEADVLLCSTIIESGLDIPRANTIIINRADALGLAQLYQLRGRVGRSNRRAYAYLLIPAPLSGLRHDAQRRLEAIQDLTELGSGFKLANMDLEIRGAGDLLGSEQSGNLRAVGYETYMQMLEQIIEELRGNVYEEVIDPEILLPLVARLPEEYVSDPNQRLVLYKRLSSVRDNHEIALIRDEILDRYGALPTEGENLIEVIRLKTLARRIGIVSISMKKHDFVLQVAQSSQIDTDKLVSLLTRAEAGFRVTPDHKILAAAPGPNSSAMTLLEAARDTLTALTTA